MCCSAADAHLKLLDREASGASFLKKLGLCECGLRMLWSLIGILIRFLAAELRHCRAFIPLSVALCIVLGDPALNGV